MRNAFIKTLTAIAEKDPRITLITGDLGFGVLTDFAKKFPRQFFRYETPARRVAKVYLGSMNARRRAPCALHR